MEENNTGIDQAQAQDQGNVAGNESAASAERINDIRNDPQMSQPNMQDNRNQYGEGENGYRQQAYQQSAYSQPSYQQKQAPNDKNGMAIASLVLGIVSITCCGGFVTAILAIIFGIMGRKEEYNRNYATAGMILGIVAIALCIVGIIIYFTFFASMMSNGNIDFWRNIPKGKIY